MRKRLTALAALLCLLLCLVGCGEPPVEDAPVRILRIWTTASEPMAAALEQTAAEFSARGGALRAELTVFPDEEGLAKALNDDRPELLLCSGERAVLLYSRNKLSEIDSFLSSAPEYAPTLESSSECVGSAFFPLGISFQLLAVNEKAYRDYAGRGFSPYEDLPAMCADAKNYQLKTGRPFFALSSCAELFYAWMLQTDDEFHGERSQDILSENYVTVYNLLAEAAFDHSLNVSADTAALLAGGETVAAFSSSADCATLGEDFGFYPVPAAGGAEYPVLCCGLAVTCAYPDVLPDTAQFLDWIISPERSGTLALDSGCFPAAAQSDKLPDTPLNRALSQVVREYSLIIPPADSDYSINRNTFDAEFRRALELLY